MKVFDYLKLEESTWNHEIVFYLTQIYELKGKQEVYIKQKQIDLKRLEDIAKMQSIDASNRIEGIVTTNTRLKKLMENKIILRNIDEKEILGYRNVWNMVDENYEYISVSPNYILQLHGEMLKQTAFSYGGKFKMSDN